MSATNPGCVRVDHLRVDGAPEAKPAQAGKGAGSMRVVSARDVGTPGGPWPVGERSAAIVHPHRPRREQGGSGCGGGDGDRAAWARRQHSLGVCLEEELVHDCSAMTSSCKVKRPKTCRGRTFHIDAETRAMLKGRCDETDERAAAAGLDLVAVEIPRPVLSFTPSPPRSNGINYYRNIVSRLRRKRGA